MCADGCLKATICHFLMFPGPDVKLKLDDQHQKRDGLSSLQKLSQSQLIYIEWHPKLKQGSQTFSWLITQTTSSLSQSFLSPVVSYKGTVLHKM